jgi:hypothetical protein
MVKGGKRMNKILTIFCSLLFLAAAWVPAYASPTNKKITISCDTTNPGDVFTGWTTVTLCPSPTSVEDCNINTVDAVVCGTVNCSIGGTDPISQTVACSTPFRVETVTVDLGIEGLGTNDSHTVAARGRISFPYTSGNDTVSVTVK